jgi:hypothetical protein
MEPKPTQSELERGFARVRSVLERHRWPGVEEGPSYGTPGLKVKGKFMVRLKDADTLVLRTTLDEKELMMELEPAIFFETDHYKGWPAVLVRLAHVDADRLASLIEKAWRLQAPKKLVAEWEASRAR